MLPGVALVGTAPRHKSFLFQGPPGTGKTWAAMRCFRKARKLVIDADRKLAASIEAITDVDKGLISVWTPSATISEDNKIGIFRVERKSEDGKSVVPGTKGYIPGSPKGFEEIVGFVNSLLELAAKGDFPFDVLVLDTLTELSTHLERLILAHHKVSTFTLPLWGVYKNNMVEAISGLLALPCHKIIVTHSTVRENEDTQEITVRPSILGSYKDEIGKNFTEAYYFFGKVGNPSEYQVLTSATKRYIARTTFPGFQAEEKLEKVIAHWQ